MDATSLARNGQFREFTATQVVTTITPTSCKVWYRVTITAISNSVQLSYSQSFNEVTTYLREGETFTSERLSVADIPAVYYSRYGSSNATVRIIVEGF